MQLRTQFSAIHSKTLSLHNSFSPRYTGIKRLVLTFVILRIERQPVAFERKNALLESTMRDVLSTVILCLPDHFSKGSIIQPARWVPFFRLGAVLNIRHTCHSALLKKRKFQSFIHMHERSNSFLLHSPSLLLYSSVHASQIEAVCCKKITRCWHSQSWRISLSFDNMIRTQFIFECYSKACVVIPTLSQSRIEGDALFSKK